MKLKWPKRLRGTGKSLVWLNNLLDCAKQCEPQPGQDHRIVPAPAGGFRMENVIRPKSLVSSDLSALHPRGTWIDGTNYNQWDLIITSDGDPTTGIGVSYSAWYWAGPESSSTTMRPNIFATGAQGETIVMNGWVLLANCHSLFLGFGVSGTVTVTDTSGAARTLSFNDGHLVGIN